MQKFLAIACALMLLTAFGATVAQEPSKGHKKLVHRYQVVFHQMERLRIGMDAVISYAEEIDANTGKLVTLRDEFVSKAAELNAKAVEGDLKGFNSVLAQIRGIVKEFRLEAHKVLGNKVGEAQVRVANALRENKEYLQTLIDNIARARKDADLEAMDNAVKDAEKKVERLEERGADVTPLKEKLEEISKKREALREKLEGAINSCKGIGLGRCNTTQALEYKALRDEIRREFRELRKIGKEIGRKVAIFHVIKVSERIIERTKKQLEIARERGEDTTVALAKLEQVIEILESAKEKYKAKEYQKAIDDLKAVREAFVSVRKEIGKPPRAPKTPKPGAVEEEPERGPPVELPKERAPRGGER